MKAQTKKRTSTSRLFQNLVILSSLAMLAIGCGNENTSGKGNNNAPINNGFGVGGVGGFGDYGNLGNMNSQQALNIIASENNCRSNGMYGNQQINGSQRVMSQVQIQGANANVNSIYIGVSTYGDIAVVQNQNGITVADLYLCQRAGMSNNVTQSSNVVLVQDNLCPFAKIDLAYFTIQGQSVQYSFGISSIHIPGTDRISQLCQNY